MMGFEFEKNNNCYKVILREKLAVSDQTDRRFMFFF